MKMNKTNNKMVAMLMVLVLALTLIGCGENKEPATNEVVESTESTESSIEIVESEEETTTETESKDIVDGKVPNGDKPAEPTAEPSPEPTEKPAEPSETEKPAEQVASPTEKPQATATPEPTPIPHIHDFKVESSVPASCTAEGQVVKVCNCGEKQVEAIPMVEHSWEETINSIHHDALGHVAQVQVQVGTTDKRTEYECSYCGARFNSASEKVDHCVATGDINHAGARTIAHDYPGEPIYETQSTWIVDQEAWDETITNYKCSVCGATR